MSFGPRPRQEEHGDEARRNYMALDRKLSLAAEAHILEGDERGGGHRHGVLPKPGNRKLWFPEAWSDTEIVESTRAIMNHPVVVAESRAYFNAYGERDRVRVKVRLGHDGNVITSHPVDGDGVVVVRVSPYGQATFKDAPYGASREVSW